MRYDVTWGDDTKRVYAESEADAWSEYARGNDLAYRCPHLHTRTIVEVDENEQSGTDADFPQEPAL